MADLLETQIGRTAHSTLTLHKTGPVYVSPDNATGEREMATPRFELGTPTL